MFKWLIDKIKSIGIAKWIKTILEYVWANILVPVFTGLGEHAIGRIQHYIIEASNQPNLSGREKFEYVFDKCREEFSAENISDHLLNLLIEILFAILKKKGMLLSRSPLNERIQKPCEI